MKLSRFDYVVWGAIALAVLALAGVLLLGDQIGAQVAGTLPSDGGEVGGAGRIGLEFVQPMQAESVESRFSVQPATSGQFSWDGQTVWFTPDGPLEPGQQYTARLEAGAVSAQGRLTKADVVWRFTVRQPSILYIAPTDARELWRKPLDGEPEQLTSTGGNVYDFAVSPDGEQIAYSVVNDENGVDLWLMTDRGADGHILVDCKLDRCSVPSWSPDGKRLAYSRENAGIAPGAPPGPPRAWLADSATGQTTTLYEDQQVLGYGPSWSPDGRRIALLDGIVGGIRVLDLQTQEELILPTQMGLVGSWSPDGNRMLFNDLSLTESQPLVKMFLADFTTRQINAAFDQSATPMDYGMPSWSPSGEWIAVGVRLADGGPGSQLWIMRPDGSEARAVTSDPQYTCGSFHWDSWGRNIVFQRFELGVPFAKPEIMLWSAGTGGIQVIARDASLPNWLP